MVPFVDPLGPPGGLFEELLLFAGEIVYRGPPKRLTYMEHNMSVISINGDDVEVETVNAPVFGPLEVTTKELGEILDVSPVTISNWVQQGKITPGRTNGFGGGRPGFVFDLAEVFDALDEADQETWPQVRGYLIRVGDAIAELSDEFDYDTEEETFEEVTGLMDVDTDVVAELAVTQMALGKFLAATRGTGGEPPMFTYSEAVAIHNAISVYDETMAD